MAVRLLGRKAKSLLSEGLEEKVIWHFRHEKSGPILAR